MLPGKTLERYELQDRIAVGGMAEVYRAVAYGAHGFEKTLAIKRILPELARDPEFEARFIAEAKLAVQLTHANVVQVFDFGRFGGTLFIAMEFVDGLDLAALLKRGRERDEKIPIPAAFQIAIEIARGLDFAHQHEVVHRDVSPSNILLSKAGEVKIADFGIAQAATTEVRARPSGKRKIMGKWRYMSPEQTYGEDLTVRSDTFSAASVLFELFTGDKLFPGDEAEEIIRNIHEMPIPLASERRLGLPLRLDEVLARCLARDPHDRPGQPGEVVRALTEISYESSIVATPLDVAEAVRVSVLVAGKPKEKTPSGRAAGLDELIRKQLGGGAAPAVAHGGPRRTAVDEETPIPPPGGGTEIDDAPHGARTHTATVVKKGVDADGLTLWEVADGDEEAEDTIAAVPSAIRFGRSTGSQQALSAAQAEEMEQSTVRPESARSMRWLALLLMLVAGGGAGIWALTRGGGSGAASDPAAVTGESDAAVTAAQPAVLELDSVPPGARVWVDGNPLPDPTPTGAEVAADHPHKIEIEADGYARFTLDAVQVEAGKTFPIKPMLAAIRASLSVHSTPDGAEVELDGQPLGQTPLERADLVPGGGRELVIKKRGYTPLRLSVDLVAGETATVDRQLDKVVEYGQIRIGLHGWADVYLGQKKIGTVPREPLKLPVGHHKLRLHNPKTNQDTTLEVDVVAGKTKLYHASW